MSTKKDENDILIETKSTFEEKIDTSFEEKPIKETMVEFNSAKDFIEKITSNKIVKLKIKDNEYTNVEIRGIKHKEFIIYEELKEPEKPAYTIYTCLVKPKFTMDEVENLPIDITNKIYSEILALSFLRSME